MAPAASMSYGPKTRIRSRRALDRIVMRQSPDVEESLSPFQFIVIALAGWMNQRQQQTIEYLGEENRVLREQRGNRRLRFNDDRRRRLAAGFSSKGRFRPHVRNWIAGWRLFLHRGWRLWKLQFSQGGSMIICFRMRHR
jgi:hypothetical protein